MDALLHSFNTIMGCPILKQMTRLLVSLLLIVNILLLYLHYQEASATQGEAAQAEYSQEIEVMNRVDGILVRHHFNGLSNKRYEIVWPEKSTNRSCLVKEATSCSRLNEEMTAFSEGEVTKQSIMYMLPKVATAESTLLMRDLFVQLYDHEAKQTTLHLSDELKLGGQWINGLNQLGSKQTEIIDYYYFSGLGKVEHLYWQSKEVPLVYAGDYLTVYSDQPLQIAPQITDQVLQDLEAKPLVVMAATELPIIDTNRFIITSSHADDSLSEKIMIHTTRQAYGIPNDQLALAEVIAAFLSNQAIGSERAKAMFAQLTAGIPSQQMEEIRVELAEGDWESMNASGMDSIIEKVTGYRTTFFQQNMADASVVHSLLFQDARDIQLNGVPAEGVRVLQKDGQTFYLAEPLLTALGFTVRSNERSYYFESPTQHFRFPLKEPFYVYNQAKYDLPSKPFEIIEGEFYFEEQWLKRLFLFMIEKSEENINIIPIKTMIEEAATQ